MSVKLNMKGFRARRPSADKAASYLAVTDGFQNKTLCLHFPCKGKCKLILENVSYFL